MKLFLVLFITLVPSVVLAEENIFHEEEREQENETLRKEKEFEQEASMLGHLNSTVQFDTEFDREGEDIIEWTQELDLRLDLKTSSEWSFSIQGEFFHWTGGKENKELVNLYINPQEVRSSSVLDLGATYLNYQKGPWNIRAGNLITRWGSTDISRPLDIVNPKDQTRMLGANALRRLPQLSVDMTWSMTDIDFSFLFVPFFKADRSFIVGRDSSFLSGTLPLDNSLGRFIEGQSSSNNDLLNSSLGAGMQPDEDPTSFSFGGRGTWKIWNSDLSLSYFFGWDRTPTFFLDEDLRSLGEILLHDEKVMKDFDFLSFLIRNPEATNTLKRLTKKAKGGQNVVSSKYDRLQTLGLDGVHYFANVGLRFDLAFHPSKAFITDDFYAIRRPTINGAIALSYENIQEEKNAFSLSLEIFMEDPWSYKSAGTRFFVPENQRGAHDRLLLVGDRNFGIATHMLWAVEDWPLTFLFGARSDFSKQDLLFTASAAYKWGSKYHLEWGGTFFESFSEKLSIGKAFDHNDHLWFGVGTLF